MSVQNNNHLAFGESHVKARIKNVLSFKKPTIWIIIIAVVMVLGAIGAFSTNSDENATYSSEDYKITFKYPADWERNPNYVERYEGKDGFFQVGAINGENLSIDEVTQNDAFHKLNPYGSNPKIIKLTIDGQEARLILPSNDQPKEMRNQAGLIVKYPETVEINGALYHYLIIWADKAHIERIGNTLTFMKKQIEGEDGSDTSHGSIQTTGFNWVNGIKIKDILDYLNVSDEERIDEFQSIFSIFDRGNTIYLKTKKGSYRASLNDKQVKKVNHTGRVLDRRFTSIHGFLFYDTIEEKEINVADIVDLKDYETEHVDFVEVDYCKNKVFIPLYPKNANKGMTSWGVYLEAAFPTYLLFDLQDYSYEFIKLSEIVYDENNADTSADAVLIDSSKILISYKDHKVSRCRALIYDLSMKKVVEEYDLDWNYKIAHRIADCVVSPDGRYLLYHESGQTPVDLFLYDMVKHKEYNIVHYQPGKEEMFTFYNWDSEDIFYYGTYNTATREGTVYSREAQNYDSTSGYGGHYLTRSFWQEYYSKMKNPLTIEALAKLLSRYGKDLKPEHLMEYSHISFGSGIVCWQYFMEDGYVFSIYSIKASDQPESGFYMILEQVVTLSVDYVDGSWYEYEDIMRVENVDAIMRYLEV